VALVLAGCCKSQDIESAAASAACKGAGTVSQGAEGNAACNRCCRAQKTTRGTVYGQGTCACYNASNTIVAPELSLSTELAIADAARPPSFRLSGPSDAVMFVVLGPFPDRDALHLYNQKSWSSDGGGKVIWSLKGVDVTATAGSYPVIKYGTLPKEFTAWVGPPPPLETGHFYIARVAGNEQLLMSPTAALRDLCFEAQATKITETPCKGK
jgi:hypothetical protein